MKEREDTAAGPIEQRQAERRKAQGRRIRDKWLRRATEGGAFALLVYVLKRLFDLFETMFDEFRG